MDYSVRAIVVLASNGSDVMSKRRIAEKFDIPINFLAIILPKLVHAGIIESLPGPKGGYRLAKPSNKISMLDVIIAVHEHFALSRCQDPKRSCDQKHRCPVAPFWQKLQGNVESYLKGVTFEELSQGLGKN